MALLVPPPRNLSREGLNAFVFSMGQARLREEERERQEDAADAGGGGWGAAAGGIIGGIVGGIWNFGAGAAVGASIGAGIGGGLGGAIGEAVDPAGVNYGGSGAVAGRYLQAGTQQVLQGLAMGERQAEVERREGVRATEARVAREARTLPPGITESDFEAMLQSPFGPTGATVEESIGAAGLRQGLQSEYEARQIESTIQKRVGTAAGIKAAQAEQAKYEDWQKDPNQFLYNSSQAARRQTLEGARDQIDNMDPEKVTPVEMQGLQAEQRRAERTFVRGLKRKPQQPMTYPQLVSSGQPGVPGRNYSFPHPQHGASRSIGAVSFADKGKPFFVPNPMNNLYKREGLDGWWEMDENMQHRRPEAQPTPKGAKGKGGAVVSEFNADKARTEINKQLMLGVPVLDETGKQRMVKSKETGEMVPETRLPTREDRETALDEASIRHVLREDEATNQQILADSESRKELLDTLAEDDPKLKAARQLIVNWERASYPVLEEAIEYVMTRIDDVTTGREGKFLFMPTTLRRDLARYTQELSAILTESARRALSGATSGFLNPDAARDPRFQGLR